MPWDANDEDAGVASLAEDPYSTAVIGEIPADLRRRLMSVFGLALAASNVIMQLSRRPVGRGVVESTVESGSLVAHPLKRTRTTLTYIVIALYGTDAERAVMRREVARQHRAVRSDGPVAYDAGDPALQLWVAACLYRGLEDSMTFLYGPQDPDVLDRCYRHAARFATTLAVPPSAWPPTRDDFAAYFAREVARIEIDDETRRYLLDLASLSFLPAWVGALAGSWYATLTLGFLPDAFRRALRVEWTTSDERVFRRLCRTMARLNGWMPAPVRSLPWTLVLRGARRRIATGRSIV